MYTDTIPLSAYICVGLTALVVSYVAIVETSPEPASFTSMLPVLSPATSLTQTPSPSPVNAVPIATVKTESPAPVPLAAPVPAAGQLGGKTRKDKRNKKNKTKSKKSTRYSSAKHR